MRALHGRALRAVLAAMHRAITRVLACAVLAGACESTDDMGSDNGGKAAAILYSMMASAKANQAEPFAYVRDLLSKLTGCSSPAVATLLPDAWLATHPESRRCWSR